MEETFYNFWKILRYLKKKFGQRIFQKNEKTARKFRNETPKSLKELLLFNKLAIFSGRF